MKKYVVWMSIWEGEYVRADEVVDDGTTVSFLRNWQTIRQYEKDKILEYKEVIE